MKSRTATTRGIATGLQQGMLVLCLSIMVACTKEVPYKDAFKDPGTSNKAMISKGEYLASSASGNISRSSGDGLPFSFGENRRVKLEFTENSLRVMEHERDARFTDNKANDKLVIEIPVEHLAYECKKDKYGDCGSEEVEKNDIPWNQKPYFRLKLAEVKSGQFETLPILSETQFGCYEEVSSKLVNYDITRTSLNFQIEKTFKMNLLCGGDIEELSDVAVTAQFYYSMVTTESILSKDYVPVDYPHTDEGKFGFFSTKQYVLDRDNNKTEKGKHTILNRWNPNRKELVFSLSDNFDKPENKLVKELTFKTVENLNAGLEKAGVNFRMKLENPSGKSPGDIRNSMIVLVEDPVASSVIGYGPQTEDPVTGEIVSARTIMFSGTIKKYIKYTYNSILKAIAEKKREKNQAAAAPVGPQAEPAAESKSPSAAKAVSFKQTPLAKLSSADDLWAQAKASTLMAKKIRESLNTSAIAKEVASYTSNVNEEMFANTLEARAAYFHDVKNCGYAPPMETMYKGLSPALVAQFNESSKPWSELSDEEKNKVIEIIMPSIWIPVLLHELGHNLGLRHNFAGSEDFENFYSKEELTAMGYDRPIPSSTIMEYIEDTVRLHHLGNYDIAALKFGYLRSVEDKKGDLIPLESTLAAYAKTKKLPLDQVTKEYQFCTDEHTGINAGCRRFDQGLSMVDIVNHLIESYEERYERRAFRDGRASFSQLEDISHAASVRSQFNEIRLMMEIVERVHTRAKLPYDSPEWGKVEFLKDLRLATAIGGKFLASVLTTPDLHCASVSKTQPQAVRLQPLRSLNPGAMSCNEIKPEEGFEIIGSIGKHFNSMKDPKSENVYADQIDIRGYWIDRLEAARALFSRQIRSTLLDKQTDNYADLPELKSYLLQLTANMALHFNTQTLEMTLNSGEKVPIKVAMNTFDLEKVAKPFQSSIAKRLEVPNYEFNLSSVINNIIVKEMDGDTKHALSGRDFAEAFRVVRSKKVGENGMSSTELAAGYTFFDLGNTRFIAAPENLVAGLTINKLQMVSIIGQIPRPKLEEMLSKIKPLVAANKGPLTPEQIQAAFPDKADQMIASFPPEVIEAYLRGDLGTPEQHLIRLQELPSSN